MWDVLMLLSDLATLGIIIALVQTHMLRRLLRGLRRSTTTASKVSASSFMSCRLAPATTTARGMPCPSVSTLRFVPPLPRSVGVEPVASPPKGIGMKLSVNSLSKCDGFIVVL
jgi:hypothetical protein